MSFSNLVIITKNCTCYQLLKCLIKGNYFDYSYECTVIKRRRGWESPLSNNKTPASPTQSSGEEIKQDKHCVCKYNQMVRGSWKRHGIARSKGSSKKEVFVWFFCSLFLIWKCTYAGVDSWLGLWAEVPELFPAASGLWQPSCDSHQWSSCASYPFIIAAYHCAFLLFAKLSTCLSTLSISRQQAPSWTCVLTWRLWLLNNCLTLSELFQFL